MSESGHIASIRLLPEDVANKIAAGEVVERPASVVKELVENALDAGATRISVRVLGAGRHLIEVIDNGHGMSEQDALLAIERHATSKIRTADDLDEISTLGFRGEALASIASVSRFELVTRRAKDESGTQIHIDGGILRDTGEAGSAVGTRISVNRLYFNTPVRAKFLKGMTTELGHCIDAVQRHALSHVGVGFQFVHNEKMLLDIPEAATLRERVALIWGLKFVNEMIEIEGEQAGFTVTGFTGNPGLNRSTRSHQFFFMNERPVKNRSLQFGFEDGYSGLVTIGRHPVGIVMVSTHPRFVDVNIHPSKRDIRFRDERAARDAIRDIVRRSLEDIRSDREEVPVVAQERSGQSNILSFENARGESAAVTASEPAGEADAPVAEERCEFIRQEEVVGQEAGSAQFEAAIVNTEDAADTPVEQTEFLPDEGFSAVAPEAVYRAGEPTGSDVTMQLFDTYLLVPEDDRLLIIDQHALHERLNYDLLMAELRDKDYASQQLAVPLLIDVPPSSARLIETNLELFESLGIEIESFGGNTFQVTSICHLYEESKVGDAVYQILDELSQGNLFDREDFLSDFMRVATQACRASVKAGDKLSFEEKQGLIDGFRRLRPPYTCPHGRPIITELTLMQMEKSFRRRQ
ncbi:MAG: DNA mismatch repair endonuclease MutL [Candidatus Hydrogenedentota bacterium]